MKKIVLLLTVLAASQFTGTSQTAGITWKPCNAQAIQDAKCGTFEVFENRAAPTGRKISLNLIVFPATGPDRAPDPLFYIPGGPGQAATDDAPYIAKAWARIREHRDLVFLDQRGTGGSNPLNCDLFNSADPQSYFGYFLPLDDVKKCREKLATDADLTLYTTTIAMDDLDEVRAALGYEKINLFGGSYGTRASLVYLRQHPNQVRTVMLHGVAPTNLYMPSDFPQGNERALNGVVAECAADQACNAAFPHLGAEVKTVLDRLLQGPVEVEVNYTDPKRSTNGSAAYKVKLSRDLAAEAIRYMMYSTAGASRVPLFIHQAANGNFAPLAQAALRFRMQIVATGSNGLYLSITCSEDLPWVKPADAARMAANTFLGDYRYRQQKEACGLWPQAKVSSDYSKPTRSSVPVLIMTGDLDPVTPPSNGDATAKNLPNSLHVVVPHGGHGFAGLQGVECIDQLMARFVEQGSTKNLDTSCVKSIRRSGFVLK